MILTGETEVLGQKPVPVQLFPPQFSHGLAWNQAQSSAVSGWGLTA
jgi:hypothetical protein